MTGLVPARASHSGKRRQSLRRQFTVQRSGTNLYVIVRAFVRPAHLLLFGHSLAHQFDLQASAFDQASRELFIRVASQIWITLASCARPFGNAPRATCNFGRPSEIGSDLFPAPTTV